MRVCVPSLSGSSYSILFTRATDSSPTITTSITDSRKGRNRELCARRFTYRTREMRACIWCAAKSISRMNRIRWTITNIRNTTNNDERWSLCSARELINKHLNLLRQTTWIKNKRGENLHFFLFVCVCVCAHSIPELLLAKDASTHYHLSILFV